MWIDITMPLRKNMPTWPDDTAFSYTLDATYDEAGANVGRITMGLHNGTHIDAPYHYDDFGKSIDALPLDLFNGLAQIIDVTNTRHITVQTLKTLALEQVERLFFKTRSTPAPYIFDADFTTIDAEAIHYLASRGVRVIGTDAPSVDAVHAPLLAHEACRDTEIIIIENLVLHHVEPNLYEFIGLPLAIAGADASPIRAIIRKHVKQEQ